MSLELDALPLLVSHAEGTGELAMWTVDLRHRTATMTRAARELFGISDGTPITPDVFMERIHADDRAGLREVGHRAMTSNAPYQLSVRLNRPGEERWVSIRANVTLDEQGRAATVLVLSQDITQLHEARRAKEELEERLRREQRLMASVLRKLPMGVIVADPAGNILLANDTLRASAEPLLGDSSRLEDLERFGAVHADGKPFSPAEYPLVQALADGQTHSVETSYRRPDGRLDVLRLEATAVRDESGELLAIVGTSVDLTASVASARACAAAEEDLRATLEAIPAIVFRSDRQGQPKYLNEQFFRVTGLSRERWADAWQQAIHPDDLPPMIALFQGAVATGEAWEQRYRLRQPDGSYRWYLGRSLPVRRADGSIDEYLGAAVDVDAQVQAEAALKRADESKDEFLATLAQELRNPLAPIRNAVELMRLRASQEPAIESSCATIERQLRQLSRLVDDLLDVSRISRGKIELRSETVSVSEVLAAAAEASRPLIDSRAYQLRLDLPQEELHVWGDRERLAQVVSNLLNNAAKYTPEHGRIELSVRSVDGSVQITVRDNGFGISREDQAQIFRPFFQARDLHARSQGGLGIGLALVRKLVELHGGTVSAVSAGRDRGSAFTVTLPIIASAGTGARTGSRPRVEERSTPRSILLVDDNADAAETLGELLQSSGHHVHVLNDGARGIAWVREHAPDVAVLDIGLPGLDGHEVARQLRANGYRGLLVALSGYGQPRDRQRSKEAGFDHHMVKPADLDALLSLIEARGAARPSRPVLVRS